MIKLPSALVLGLRIKSTHPVTELLSMFSIVEEILFHTVKNWGGVTVDPPAEWEKY